MRKLLILLGIVLTTQMLKAELLVKVPGVPREMIHILSKSGQVDVVDYRDGTLTAIIYDGGAVLRSYGLNYSVILDLEEERKKGPKPGYHTLDQFYQLFDSLATAYPDICILDTIGFSVQGRPIIALKVSDNPQLEEFEPEIRFVANIHGNEKISGEIMYRYAPYLLENYGVDPLVTYLVDNREIWIVPILNPDGFVADQRRNAASVDLNRDYGYMWDAAGNSPEPYSQPETKAICEHAQLHNFTVSLTFHSGAFYVNYPWNYTPVRLPDTPFLLSISEAYGDSTGYPVTEGYDWYQTRGDLNDYSYGIDSDLDITIEVWGNDYNPDPSMVDSVYRLNRGAMNMIALKGGQGIGGFVIDSLTGDTLKEARIYVEGIDWPIYTDRVFGDFMKVLLPGTYTLRVEANGYQTKTVSGIQVFEDSLTHVDVFLVPDSNASTYAFKPVEVVVEASNYSRIPVDTFLVGNMLGEPDGRFYYLGVGGHVVLDMGERTPASNEIIVHEGNDGVPNEGYTLYGSNNWNGPWTLIGSGHGTQEFTLSEAYRYLKIVDDGDGSNSDPNCGFDLDAIEVIQAQGPYLVLQSYNVVDTLGNGNHRLDPGEMATVEFALRNIGHVDAQNIVFHAFSEDSRIQVINGDGELGAVPSQATASSYFDVDVSNSMPRGTQVELGLVVSDSATGYLDTLMMSFVVGELTVADPTGPDNYGYYAFDSNDSTYAEWPEYNWVEISSVGTPISLGDDDAQLIPLPFTFRYYGQPINQISVCSNGFIAMNASLEHPYSNSSLPYSDGIVMVAPLWDDLDPFSGGNVYYHYQADSHRFIVEWKNVPHYGSSATETFEVILYDPAYYPRATGDGDIVFQYQTVSDNSSCTVGIESPSESDALLYLYNGTHPQTADMIRSGFAIRFTTGFMSIVEDNEVYPQTRTAILTRGLAAGDRLNLRYSVSKSARIDLKIYDISGRLTKEIHHGYRTPGEYSVKLNGLKNGVYFVRLIADGREIDRAKVMVIR